MGYTATLIPILVLAGAAAFVGPAYAGPRAKGGGAQARIDGIVVTESGATVAGVFVFLESSGNTASVRSGRRGEFRFSKLAAGSYTVRAIVFKNNPVPPGLFVPELMGTVEVELGAGGRARVVVILRPVG